MSPTKIMVIRHGEKPGEPTDEPGLMTPNGPENEKALTATGWKRAEALVGLFDPIDGKFADPLLETPQTLFASADSDATKSLRPEQTITPLAEALNLPINTEFTKGEESELVEAAKQAAGAVLIAWQHEAIPAIADLIRDGDKKDVPQHWPGHTRFDLVWVFDLEDNGKWSFAQVPQLLLPGDSPDPIPVNK
jgi:broad specificity phosphatase PhoE